MIWFLYRLLFWAVPATPTLLALGILLLTQPLACLLRLAWAVTAALVLKDCDLATKLLPENKSSWPGRVAWVTACVLQSIRCTVLQLVDDVFHRDLSRGASSGIGLSLVRQLAARGCYLIISSRRKEDLKAARDDAIAFASNKGVHRAEKDFFLLPFDVKDRQSFTGVVETGRKWKGRIDLLFSNAGIACRGVMLPSAIDQEILDVNLCGQMHFIKLIVAQMMQQQKGQVIITNSMSARIALGGRTAYSAAKAGLLNFAYGLSRELRGMHSAVTITSVLPGYVKTNLCDRELYADQLNLPKGAHMAKEIQSGLSANRSAELILRGSSRGLGEIWVGKNPDLLYMYCMFYVPGIANRVVDHGAAVYLHSIEHEIRERRYAERCAAGLGSSEQGNKESEQSLPSSPATNFLPENATFAKDPQVSEPGRGGDLVAELLSGGKEGASDERQIPSVYVRAAKDTVKIGADAFADVGAQLQQGAVAKLKDVTGSHSHPKPEQHEQQSQQPHLPEHPAEGEGRKHDSRKLGMHEEKKEGRQGKSHMGSADKHRNTAPTHSAT